MILNELETLLYFLKYYLKTLIIKRIMDRNKEKNYKSIPIVVKFSIFIHSFDYAIPKVTVDFEICTPLVLFKVFSLMGTRYIFSYKYVQDFE